MVDESDGVFQLGDPSRGYSLGNEALCLVGIKQGLSTAGWINTRDIYGLTIKDGYYQY